MNTKRLITTSIFALISASTAQAADVMIPHQPTPVASSTSTFVAPDFTWTGLYVGAQAGGFSSKTDINIVGKHKTTPLGKDLSPKLSGFEGGLYIGSNIDLGDNFILGIDTDFTWSGQKHTKDIIIGAPENTAVDNLVSRSRRSVSVGGTSNPSTTGTAQPAPAKPVSGQPAAKPVKETAPEKPVKPVDPAKSAATKPTSTNPAALTRSRGTSPTRSATTSETSVQPAPVTKATTPAPAAAAKLETTVQSVAAKLASARSDAEAMPLMKELLKAKALTRSSGISQPPVAAAVPAAVVAPAALAKSEPATPAVAPIPAAAPAPAKPVAAAPAAAAKPAAPAPASPVSAAAASAPVSAAAAKPAAPAAPAGGEGLVLARSASSESEASVANGANNNGHSYYAAHGGSASHGHGHGHGSGGHSHGVGANPHATGSHPHAANPHAVSNNPHGSNPHGLQSAAGRSAQGTEAAENGSNVYGIEQIKEMVSELGLGDNGPIGTLSHTLKQNWAGATRVRIGFAADRFMPYIAGGVAYTQLQDTLSVSVKKDDGTAIVSKNLTDETKTMVGYTIGGGFDFAMLDNVILRAEYRYSDFGKKKFAKEKLEIKYTTNDFRVGVAYKF
ncbi:outer membrane protein [Bartonella raoultii]|uniref:outer membrane protein n=1 Tax=Bartonella raoultii TaxID=1457020 RepID=UPI001ABA4784|nr:porin [Bartonella raoultii]